MDARFFVKGVFDKKWVFGLVGKGFFVKIVEPHPRFLKDIYIPKALSILFHINIP